MVSSAGVGGDCREADRELACTADFHEVWVDEG